MAFWNTFHWSDGTLWSNVSSRPDIFTAPIDRSAHFVSARITMVSSSSGSTTASLVIHTLSLEVNTRSQLPDYYEAFIDRNDNTQRISTMVRHTTGVEDLLTETSELLTTETSETLILDEPYSFVVNRQHLLMNKRSRIQPTG